jgi:ABC-2 type transport system permease protein
VKGLWRHFATALRLHFRNRIALLYGNVFPLIFLAVFWVLYRHERVPLLRHLGELLTVTVLGGACFGLPTALVSERERGVWRRYQLTPVPVGSVVASTLAARFLIILIAGLIQFAVALAVGMTAPAHPLALVVAFTVVTFAFMGLGLVIAALADNVPAVQALGQCIFLPMLVIGGVAVSLASLPAWAQHVSAFFPGRYAVEALQQAVTGSGLPGMRFSLLALGLTGVAGILAGAKLFRVDAQRRLAAQASKAWVVVVFAAWAAAGLVAESRGRVALVADAVPRVAPVAAPASAPAVPPPPPWVNISAKDVASLDFNVPSDGGVVAPMATSDDQPDDFSEPQIERVRAGLPTWAPGLIGDDLQRVRTLLCVAAVPDAIQQPVERFLPDVVLQHLSNLYPKGKLIKMLTWIAQHPEEGEIIDNVNALGVPGAVGDPELVRERVYLYAVKFIMRLTGRSTAQ